MSTTAKGLHGAYTAHQREEETLRETEARALLSCASRLEAARQPNAPLEEYLAALRHNQQLWTIFQVALCEPDNELPRDLKILLLNLSRYVDKTSFSAIAEYNPDLLGGLIEINRNIAAGLAVSAKPAESAKSETAPQDKPVSVMTTA